MVPDRAARKLRRDVGLVGLVFASFGSIIGAGWLFAALFASSLAGPAAIDLVADRRRRDDAARPDPRRARRHVPGGRGSARFPQYAFGSLIGFTSGWVAFLGAVTVAPIMVEATLLYTSNYVPSLITVAGGRPVLTAQGYVVAAAMLLLFCTINVLGVRWLAKTNVLVVCWKIFVPVLAVVALLLTSTHRANFTAAGGFMPFGWKGVFLALASGGVIFACLGFEQAVQLGGESRNPRRNIPLAIIVAMLVAIGLYIALQVAFIAALDPSSLSNGWGAISFAGKGQLFGPFAALATALGSAGSPSCCTRTRSSRPAAPASSTRARARASRSPSRGRPDPRRVRSAHAQRHAARRDRVFVRLRPRDLAPVSRLAGARRLHLRRGRPHLRDGAARARRAPATGPGAAAPLPAPRGMARGTGRIRRRERDPALHGWAVVWKLIVAILIGFALRMVSALRDARERSPSLDWRNATGSGRTCSAWRRSLISAHSTRERRARSRCSASTGHATCSRSAGTSSPSRSSASSSSPSRSGAGFPQSARSNTSATPRQRQNPRTSLFAR